MWLLRLPLTTERRLALPPGRHCFPWYYDSIEIARLAEFLAGILRGVDRHWILPWSVAHTLLSAETAPNLQNTLVVITFNGDSLESEKLEDIVAHPVFRHVMLHFPEPREMGYAWQEKYLKRDLIDLIHEEISLETHPLASMNIAHLPVRLAATLTTDALGLVDLLEATLLHRLAHAANGTSAEDYNASLQEVAGRRFTERLLRLLPQQRDAAIDVLKKEGAGVWQDDQFRLGAEALQEIGLAQVGGGSVSLGPLARRTNEAWLAPLMHQLTRGRTTTRRWLVETSLAVQQAPEEWADFARASISAISGLLSVFRDSPQTQSESPRHEDIEQVHAWIRAGSTFEKRCDRARDFLTDPERTRFVRTYEHEDYSVWLEPIRAEFSENEWSFINSRIEAKVEFKILDGNRYHSSQSTERQMDAFIDKRPDAKIDLARWITFALFEGKFTYERSFFADLLSWLWRNILERNIDASLHDEGVGIVRRCLALALKNNYRKRQLIEDDAKAIGIDVASVMPAGERAPEFVLKMKDAFEKMLDGAFVEARQRYAKASTIAKYAGDTFGEWVALQSEREAEWKSRDILEFMNPAAPAVEEELRQRIQRLADSLDVARWVKKERAARDQITEMVLQRANRGAGRFSMSPGMMHEYFTMFRDLETTFAAPNLQREYVRPLINAGGFDVHEEFGYRLQLDIEKPEHTSVWLKRITKASQIGIEEAEKRDQGLRAEFTRTNTFKEERLQRLKTLPSVIAIFRVDDLTWVRDFLTTSRKDLEGPIFPGGMHFDIYAQALCAYARVDARVEAVEYFLGFDLDSASWHERRGIASNLNADTVSFERWIGLHPGLAERLARYLLDLLLRFQADGDEMSAEEVLMPALLRFFLAARRVGCFIAKEITAEVYAWANKWIGYDTEGAVHLAYLLAPDDKTRKELVERALDIARTAIPDAEDPATYAVPFAKWLELVDAGESRTTPSMANTAELLWHKLENAWEGAIDVAKHRRGNVGALVSFLAKRIVSSATNDRRVVRQKLLQLLAAAPQDLALCFEVVDPILWQNDWLTFVALVRKHAGGNNTDPTATRMGAIDLLDHWANHYTISTQLPQDVGFLVDATLWAIRDEEHLVANHAAYALAAYAIHAQTPQDVRRVADGLRALAIDARIEVRGAAAYAGKRLPSIDGIHNDIRIVAREIDEQLAKDPYAIVHRQRVFGELDGRYPPRQNLAQLIDCRLSMQ